MTRLCIVLLLAGCDLEYEPDVGPLHALDEPDAGSDESDGGAVAPGRCEDSDPTNAVLFSRDILPLLTRSPGACTSCHGASATAGFAVGSYTALRAGGQVSGERIVIAGDPCGSVLYQKLGLAPPYGARMPYNGPPFYSSADLALVRDWIAEGAHDN
jgi:hypothetical protein